MRKLKIIINTFTINQERGDATDKGETKFIFLDQLQIIVQLSVTNDVDMQLVYSKHNKEIQARTQPDVRL